MNAEQKGTLIDQLFGFVTQQIQIRKETLSSHVLHTFEKCLQFCLALEKKHVNEDDTQLMFEIDSVLDYLHEELNTGHWSTVPIEIRENFTIGSFLKVVILLSSSKDFSTDVLQQCLKSIDMGLLLGAPLEENPELLTKSAKHVRMLLNSLEPDEEFLADRNHAKRKFSQNNSYQSQFEELDGITVKELDIPSLETFNKDFFMPQVPVKLRGCMTHWPASTKWLDLNYLLKVAGNRTVPVEIGSHYTDENWSQKLMTLKEFISRHYLSESGDIGYLAQHNLFDQISELKDDIRVPEYCCCSLNYEDSSEPDINAWLGPKGTVSPLHQDPKNNILAQVYGTKRIFLISPQDTNLIYPHDEKMLSNTAQVDPLSPDYAKFPDFRKAKMFKCLLEPGEMLFIPVKWWHHVTAFEKSFSVSFWWQ